MKRHKKTPQRYFSLHIANEKFRDGHLPFVNVMADCGEKIKVAKRKLLFDLPFDPNH